MKQNELNNLKRTSQEEIKKYGCLEMYDDLIGKIKAQQMNSLAAGDEDNKWSNVISEMDKELKSLEMIQLFIKKNKSDELKEIKVDESALMNANDILKHFCDQK